MFMFILKKPRTLFELIKICNLIFSPTVRHTLFALRRDLVQRNKIIIKKSTVFEQRLKKFSIKDKVLSMHA